MQLIKKIALSSFLSVATMGVSHAEYTVDSIIEQNLESKGGAEKWDGINTITLKGTMNMSGMELPFEMIQKRPNKIYATFELQGMIGKQVYDGKIGWMVMPFMGKTEPELMADDQLKDFKKQADIDGPLRNYKEKGHSIEFIGESEVEGTPVVELKVTEKGGDVSNIFFDTEYMLEIKMTTQSERMGTTMETNTTISNYKDIDGIIFPHSLETAMGSMGGQTLIINSVVFNTEVDDSIFTMPEAKPAVEVKKSE